MHHGKLLTIPFFVILFGCLVLPDSARADAGDKILRGSASYVNPTSDARLGGTGIEDFLDPTNPPMVRFDIIQDHRLSADSNVGVGLDFEIMVTDRVGIDTAFNYSRQDVAADFSGQITFTPYLGQPPTLFPDLNESASIVGAGGGRVQPVPLDRGSQRPSSSKRQARPLCGTGRGAGPHIRRAQYWRFHRRLPELHLAHSHGRRFLGREQ